MKLLRSVPVNILAFLSDVTSMYILSNYDYTLSQQIYISSVIRICVSFVGHIKYTYKDVYTSVTRSAIRFFPWEILSMLMINELVIIVNNYIIEQVKKIDIEDIEKYRFMNLIFEQQGNEYELRAYVNIVIKQVLMIISYVLIDMRVYKYVFE